MVPDIWGGYRSVWHTLKLQGMQVPRDVTEQLVRERDPEGCAERKAKRLKRRRFISPGPNYSWHVMVMIISNHMASPSTGQ